jgi:hypothetical protein
MESFRADAGQVEQFLGEDNLFFGLYITFQVMAIAEMSPGHKHTITALPEGFNDEGRVNPAGTHDPHGSQVRRILQARNTRQISPGVSTPVTQKRCNLRLKITHIFTLCLVVIYIQTVLICQLTQLL